MSFPTLTCEVLNPIEDNKQELTQHLNEMTRAFLVKHNPLLSKETTEKFSQYLTDIVFVSHGSGKNKARFERDMQQHNANIFEMNRAGVALDDKLNEMFTEALGYLISFINNKMQEAFQNFLTQPSSPDSKIVEIHTGSFDLESGEFTEETVFPVQPGTSRH